MYNLLGYISAACFCLCYFPQLRKTWLTRSVEDISPWMWGLQFVAHGTGMFYAGSLLSLPLMLNFGIGMWCTTLMIIMYFMFRDPDKEQARRIIRQVLQASRRKPK